MLVKEKKIQIMWRNTSDYFELINKDVISQIIRTRPLGSSKSAINAMLRNTEEMKAIMPLILGQGHNGGQDQSFSAAVANYWNSLSYRVTFPSDTWEIGMTFDVEDSDPIRLKYISELAKQLKPKTKGKTEEGETTATFTDDDLATYVMGVNKDGSPSVKPEEMYRYGVPIDPTQFLLWQYSLNNGNVANDKSMLKNSTKMELYLVDETIAKKERESLHKIKNEASKMYLDIIAQPADVIDILAVLKKDVPYGTAEDEVKIVREQLLEEAMRTDPEGFLTVAKSANLKTLAKIERYVKAGILRRLDSTNIIVDGQNAEIIIGNSEETQLAFFAATSNKDILAEYAAKYKQTKS